MGSRIIRGTPRLSINYGYSTDNTVCFNFHFDPVSFFTLSHVCNIHSSLSLISFSKLISRKAVLGIPSSPRQTHFIATSCFCRVSN
ncbi:unnamed protein product, partial [Adineta steineri]